MPMSKTRRKLEVPAELYAAVAQAAADVGIPTATYANALLWDALQRRRRDLAPPYPFGGKKPYRRQNSKVEARDKATTDFDPTTGYREHGADQAS